MRAATMRAEARAIASEIGMKGIVRKVAALDEIEVDTDATDGTSSAAADVAARSASIFRREADYWVITYDGATIRLRDARGVRWLATLLHQPGREFHVTELAGGGVASATTEAAARVSGDGVRREVDEGELRIDARAREQYGARLRDVEEEIAEAERHQDLGRLEHARRERDALRAELIAATRGRRTDTHGERARVTVTKGIGAALERIATEHPALGNHLRATVRRDYYCVYAPDPRHPFEWES